MKEILQKCSIRRLLSLMFLVAMVGNAWGEDDVYYEQCTAVSDICNNGTYIIVISDGTNYYAVQQNTTNYVAVTPQSDGTIKNPSNLIVWTAGSTTTTNGFTFVCNSKYIYCSGSNTTLSGAGTSSSTWVISAQTTGTNTFKMNLSSSTGRYLGWSGSKYAAYANSNYVNQFATGKTFGQYSGALFIYKMKAATKNLSSIAVSGTPTKTTYEAGEALNPAGLVVTGTYSDESTETITEGINWTFNPATLTTGTTSCTATATVGSISSSAYNVTGLTVNAPKTLSSVTLSGTPTKTSYLVGDKFDFTGLIVTANYSDDSSEDVTSSATFYGVTEALTAGQTSFKTYATYKNVDSDVQNYTITVSKKTPAITIANMTINKDEEATISATTTPADAALTYSIVEGSEYITLDGSAITGVAVGTATIQASYAGNEEYDALNGTFTVTVTNLQTATKIGFDSNDKSGSHKFTNNNDISFEAKAGQSTSVPGVYSNCLRLYQNGGFITISGIKGVNIQSVKVTTGSTYESTTVGYCVDNNNAPKTGVKVTKNSTYTISNLDNQSVSIYCLGTNSDSRLEIASLEVKYTKEEITLNSIALGGSYQTEFIQNATFNHDGAVVTATYSDGDELDVTSSAVFSTPDLTTTGEKTVTVSYTFEGVTKQTSYTINVAEEIVTSIALSGDYTKVFKTSDTFSHEGVVVTATYNSGRIATIEDAEFSTPGLSTTGVKTVTVTYAEKTATYDIKVIPENAIFFESFDKNNTTGGNDGNFAQGSGTLTSDNEGWTFTKGSGAKECAKFGNSSAAGSAKTPAITLTGTAKITFKAAAWDGTSEKTTLNISATSGILSQTSVEMTKGAWTEYAVYLSGIEKSTQITFAASQASNNRFFLDEVLVETYTPAVLSISSVGWATFYTEDEFKMPENLEGYIVSESAESGKVTLTKIFEGNQIVPASTPLLIKSTDDLSETKKYEYTITTTGADAISETNLLHGNLIKGTVASVDGATQYYKLLNGSKGLGWYLGAEDGGVFSLGANRAYLALTDAQANGVKAFSISELTTAINGIEMSENANAELFNLNGQRITTPVRGQMYIKNGKKYLAK